jgi:hypothetical protein
MLVSTNPITFAVPVRIDPEVGSVTLQEHAVRFTGTGPQASRVVQGYRTLDGAFLPVRGYWTLVDEGLQDATQENGLHVYCLTFKADKFNGLLEQERKSEEQRRGSKDECEQRLSAIRGLLVGIKDAKEREHEAHRLTQDIPQLHERVSQAIINGAEIALLVAPQQAPEATNNSLSALFLQLGYQIVPG